PSIRLRWDRAPTQELWGPYGTARGAGSPPRPVAVGGVGGDVLAACRAVARGLGEGAPPGGGAIAPGPGRRPRRARGPRSPARLSAGARVRGPPHRGAARAPAARHELEP